MPDYFNMFNICIIFITRKVAALYYRQQPKSTYLFLGNVAMADLVIGISMASMQIFSNLDNDRKICLAQMGAITAGCITSDYSIGLIGIDRFLYILYGFQYQRWVYPTRARLLICMAWIIGITTGFLPLMGWYGSTCPCWYMFVAPKELLLLTFIIGVIPLIVVIVLYSLILYQATKKINQLQQISNADNVVRDNPSSGNLRMFTGSGKKPEPQHEEEKERQKQQGSSKMKETGSSSASVRGPNKWKAIKVVLFTTGCFTVTFLPFHLGSVIYSFSCTTDNNDFKCKTLALLAVYPLPIINSLNCLLNPVIYAWWHNGFRRFVKKQINFIFIRKCANTENNLTLSSRISSSKNTSVSATNYGNEEVYISQLSLSTKL